MAKIKNEEEFEDDFPEEEEDFEQEEEEIPQQKVRRQPVPPIEMNRSNKFAPKPKPVPQNRYVVYNTPAVNGIRDTATNTVIGIEEAIAEMLSRQARIEESLG